MNSCTLMAEIIQEPQLRYTSDNQTPIAEMLVQFAGLRDDDPPQTLKVVGWGNLAQEIQERFHQGDRVVIEGRLTMNTIDRPEGFKEKRAELTAQRIHGLNSGMTASATPASTVGSASTPASPPRNQTPRAAAKATPTRSSVSESSKPPAYPAASSEPMDYDDIPF